VELRFHSGNHGVEVWKISIVQATAPSQFPNALDRIQLRAVGRQIVQCKVCGVLLSPLLVQSGMMISRVVSDDNHSAPGSDAGVAKAFHERKEGRVLTAAGEGAIFAGPVWATARMFNGGEESGQS
jgi:hypothetical protein